ncbi:hypothetical protein [Bradyrhizobium septentrionale]|uniref:Uncharacterized protein n=2 Tax=Bradyrhizobium septentrionale TaxID=1404411 RepID=A0ABZ2PBV9_9BRAD|nr:hypothetical protein [Bradyrhizobium septentrionale]UGY15068.1 hypothetical protein HAP48_0042180 [Bradyrhizobium septentrionale]
MTVDESRPRSRKNMQSPYAGMTLNERIVVSGRLAEWDKAVHAADRSKMIEILTQLDLESQAESLVNQILANPEFYGYDDIK